MKNIWDEVLSLASYSLKNEDVPVGAVIVKNDKIIGKGYNTREKNQDVLGHAEINAIKDASNFLQNWNLAGCDLYVSLKPCSMCKEIIKQSRIDNVYFLLEKPLCKKEFDGCNFQKVFNQELEDKYLQEITNFFKKLREK